MNFNPFKRKPELPTNQQLIKSIIALASQPTPQSWREFYIEVLKSTLLIAQDPEAAPRPILFVDKSGEVVLPVFTDVERLKKVCPDAQSYGAIPIRELCRLALGNEIYSININPEHGPGGFLNRREMEALANGNIPDISTGDNSSWDNPDFIPMGDPKLPTQEELDKLIETASTLLQKETGVEAAYLISLRSEEGTSTLTIALQFKLTASDDEKAALTQRLVSATEKAVRRQMRVVWLEGEQLKDVASRVTPFYRQDTIQ